MTTSRALKARLVLLGTASLVAAGLSLVGAAPAQAATQSFDLWATSGSATMPGGQSVTVWGYQDADAAAARPGGPTLTVDVGDTVDITLHNQVGEPTGLLVQGQPMVPDLTGVADGGTKTYTFTASHPGTFLYEAAPLPNAQHQPAMGLYGALVVRPAEAGQAYADASTAYDADQVLLLGEIDPALSNAPDRTAFDMRTFAPKYFTINGQAYPDTVPVAASADSTQLLRFVNAGLSYHSMGVLGAGETVIALDGSPLRDARHYVAETIGPGQTLDALVEVPAARSVDTELVVYDAGLGLHNSNTAGTGGMVTSIPVAGDPSPTDDVGPVVSGSVVNAGTLSATVDDGAGHGGSNIAAAEYYLDDVTGTGTALDPVDAPLDTSSEDVAAAVDVPSGDHVYYLRGQDAAGNWGPFTSVVVSGADAGGPTTTEPLLTPNRVNGSSASGVDVTATADDSSSGNSAISAAEYFIDTVGSDGSGNTMEVNAPAAIASVRATIPPATLDGLAEGSHVISIHAQDAQGNWGEVATVNLTVDETGPLTSGLTATPSPNNGALPFNSSVPAVRVIATTMTDPPAASVNSPIATAEAFVDTVGANGTGIRLVASDGLFTDTTEGGYVDIPLSTVAAMSNGTHTVYVHAKDAAGNWGPTASTDLVVDKTRPTVSGVSAAPNPTMGAATVTLSATATDPGTPSTGVTRAEWWRGADPGVGNGTAMTISGSGPSVTVSATVPTASLNDANYPLNVRVRDAAGNWSTAGSTTLQVRGPLLYSTAGSTNPPGVAGTADDADVYSWSGSAHSRSIDVSAAPYNVPAAANVDGFDRVDATHFYLSFANDAGVTLPGLGAVQDEDVVLWNNGSWSMYFDGSTHGLGGNAALDVDALSVAGSTLFFSTFGNVNPPGTGGTADDADIYRWNGTAYARVLDASASGIPAAANVDGYARVDASHYYLSFAADTTVAGLGAVQDEDVVYSSAGTRSTYFDGTAHGLTAADLDVDAFDVP